MVEEVKTQPEEIIEGESKTGFLGKLKIHKFKILGGVLGVLVFAGAIFGAYKLGQRQARSIPGEEGGVGERVFCKERRPEVCTMECIVNPPYICGSDGKSYCSVCQACANPKVEWHIIQDRPCGAK